MKNMKYYPTERDIIIEDLKNLSLDYDEIKTILLKEKPLEKLTPIELTRLFHRVLCVIYQ